MKKIITILISMLVMQMMFFSTNANAAPSDYLILQSIGAYHSSGKGKCGKGAGFLEATDHFGEDHNDGTCRTGYYNTAQDLAISVQVTLHPGSESDKWLLHELDADFRAYGAIAADTYAVTEINGNTILMEGSGGWVYRWLSGNKVINIEYTDLTGGKPEPLEIVKAYLAKHPSTLPAMTLTELRSSANSTKWLKDEMERRLWLSEKWFTQLDLQKAEQNAALKEVVKHLDVFLKYREKYFSVTAADERKVIQNLLIQNNTASLKEKLKEYQIWWAEHKGEAINL